MIHASVRSSSKEENSDAILSHSSLKLNSSSDFIGKHTEDVSRLRKIFHQEYIILAEYKMLRSENLPGVYVIPSRESSFLWFGVVFVRNGHYEGSVLRFNIFLPESFPDGECPKVVFKPEIFHPAIDSTTGELNLKSVFPSWKRGEHHIYQILKYLCWVLNDVNASIKYAVNEEAKNMFLENKENFTNEVDKCVQYSLDHLYDPPQNDDKHYIVFESFDDEIHGPLLENMLKAKPDVSCSSRTISLSSGNFKPTTQLPNTELNS